MTDFSTRILMTSAALFAICAAMEGAQAQALRDKW